MPWDLVVKKVSKSFVKTARSMKRNAFIDATFVMAKDGGFKIGPTKARVLRLSRRKTEGTQRRFRTARAHRPFASLARLQTVTATTLRRLGEASRRLIRLWFEMHYFAHLVVCRIRRIQPSNPLLPTFYVGKNRQCRAPQLSQTLLKSAEDKTSNRGGGE